MASDPLTQVIARVTSALDKAGAVHAITGSFASSLHGEPITSADIDFVVSMTPAQASALAEELGPQLYADAEMLRGAAATHGMANLYDAPSGIKVDISVLTDTPYHAEIFKRKVRMTHPTEKVSFWVVSPEDVVLMKLLWRRHSQSQKQWDNALGVMRVQGGRLDWQYLRKWARQLEIEKDLDRLAREAGI